MAEVPPEPVGAPRAWDAFLGASPGESGRARVTLIPVPYDATTSYRTGSRDGPRAIIRASRELEDYDLELDADPSEAGIRTAPALEPFAGGPNGMIDRVDRAVSETLDDGTVVGLLGGEHSITVGAVRAFRRRHADLSVLYLDAHADMRDEYQGSPWSHACVARRVLEICPLVEVGVRSLSGGERRFIDDEGVPVFFWPHEGAGVDDILPQVTDRLSGTVYVSIDLDVLDPSIMAAVGTPEPGGMSWHAVTRLLRHVAERKRIVGFDLVELSPGEGPEACAFTAAKLAYKLIGYATALGPGSPEPRKD